VILDAHGLKVQLPRGWSGRVFARAHDVATLHAGDFPVVLGDGEFGDRSTGRMPDPGVFLALTEYRPGRGLQPGQGLFEPRRPPLPLDPAGFAATRLAHPRRGQVGAQHFFTQSGRPFCLYVVVAGGRAQRKHALLAVDRVMRSLEITPRG
jgi:hypothetical protein